MAKLWMGATVHRKPACHIDQDDTRKRALDDANTRGSNHQTFRPPFLKGTGMCPKCRLWLGADFLFSHTHLFYVRPCRGPSVHAQITSRQQPTACDWPRGGCSAESARTSLRSGMSPSTLAVPDKGRERRLAAKVRAAAKARSAEQRNTKAAVQAARCAGGAPRALLRASSLTNSAAWGLQRPPTSRPSTTSRQRRPHAISGYVRAPGLWHVQRHAELPQRCGRCLCVAWWEATNVWCQRQAVYRPTRAGRSR